MELRLSIRNRILDVLGFSAKPAPGIHILNGHRTLNETEPKSFEKMLSELSQNVKFLRAEEAVKMIVDKDFPNIPCVAFTFDDGFDECYNIFAPVLEEFGVNGIFFINPNYVDGDESYINHFNNVVVRTPRKKPMNWNQIIELNNRGFIIGAHTMDHYLTAQDDERTPRSS